MGKVAVVNTHIDTNLFRPSAYKWPDLIVSVGRLSPEKNIGSLIAAVTGLPWADLWVCGDGPEHDRLSAMKSSGMVFLGTVQNSVVALLLSQSEYFVLPSLYDQAPKSLWEAMSAGCLCIVSAKVGVVEDGVTGYLCDPDPAAIRAGLERARVDPGRERIREAARKHVLTAQAGSGLKIGSMEASQ